MKIDTSLLREKFIIVENTADENKKAMEIHAPSTRMEIELKGGSIGGETFVVRTQNMHSCARLVSQIVADFERRGPLMSRHKDADWDDFWYHTISHYEKTYNHGRWGAVYYHGQTVFSHGEYHPFFDVIEKCDARNKTGNYEKSIDIAEYGFMQAGKNMTIKYDSNVALVANLAPDEGRCSMVLRGPNKVTTFNYTIEPIEIKEKLNFQLAMETASNFLEGVQLAYMIGLDLEKVNRGYYEKNSYEHNRTKDARKRINELDIQISSVENRYKMRYRPERPNFNSLIHETERFAKTFVLSDKDDNEQYVD